jgi:hypothetical protein
VKLGFNVPWESCGIGYGLEHCRNNLLLVTPPAQAATSVAVHEAPENRTGLSAQPKTKPALAHGVPQAGRVAPDDSAGKGADTADIAEGLIWKNFFPLRRENRHANSLT